MGPDAIKVAGTAHDQELSEAKALAADRWSKLLDLEQQIQSEAAKLQARPKQRPSERNDEVLPDRTLEQRNKDWVQQTEAKATGLAVMREQANRERAELESFITKRR